MTVDYLITGGAGFIGCALATELLAGTSGSSAPRIVAVDNLHPQIHIVSERPDALPAPVELEVMDVCDSAAWDRLFARIRPRAVIHLAAETGTGQSLDEPVRHTHTNVTGTAEMLQAFYRAGFVPEHILLSSSRAVYGEGLWRDPSTDALFAPGHRTREQLSSRQFAIIAPSGAKGTALPHNHKTVPPLPTSVYGATKLTQEHLLSAWCTARDVSLSILRLQNVYGVGQSPHNPYTGIIGLFHRVAAGGGQIDVYEDGDIGRDFVYIDDVVRSMAAALLNPPSETRTLDVGSGEAKTILDAAQVIAGMYGAPAPKITGAFRYGDVRWATCDPSDLATELDVTPKVDFAEGNRTLSAWLRETGVITT